MRRRVVAAVLLTAHAAALYWVVADYRRSNHVLLVTLVSALPLAQASLLTVWGTLQRGLSSARFAAVVVGITVLWAVECHTLNLSLADDRSAAHALAFTVQAILIFAVLSAGRGIASFRSAPQSPGRQIQFGVSTLLGWIAAIAVVLGAWKVAINHAGWSIEVVRGNLFPFAAVVGACNGLIAIILVACTWFARRWYQFFPLSMLAMILVCVFAGVQAIVLGMIFDELGNVAPLAWVMLGGFQGVYFLITLAPILVCGPDHSKESGHVSSSGLQESSAGLPDTA